MAKKTLNIVESAYRAVTAEQDDTILWLPAAMQVAAPRSHVTLQADEGHRRPCPRLAMTTDG
jgi:hypothetical protein